MKRISDTLRQFKATNLKYNQAELITITLRNGFAINATTWGLAITALDLPGLVYHATKFGVWSHDKTVSEMMFSLTANTFNLKVSIPNGGTFLLPGTNTNLLQTVALGMFDGAEVFIQRCYGPLSTTMPDLTMGTEIINAGRITNVSNLNRAGCTFVVSDHLILTNANTPAKVVQTNCGHTLFDTDGRIGCKLLKASFSTTVTAAAGSSNLIIQLSAALANAAPYYDQGVITCLTGNNAGLSQTVKTQVSSTALQLVVPLLFNVAAGDTFVLAPGCDKTSATCINKFANKINYGGQPLVPPPETVL